MATTIISNQPPPPAETQPVVLDTPIGIKIESNFLVWEEVSNATKYLVNLDGSEHSVVPNRYELPARQGRYQLKVMAVGDNKQYLNSEYSPLVEYHTYGTISQNGNRQEGAFGAFDDLDKNESYMGYGFDVINSAEFSSKTVKLTNPLFQNDKLLEQRLVKQYEHQSQVSSISQSSIESFMQDWSATANLGVDFPMGSVSVSAAFGSKNESTISQHFMSMDIYNQSYYLALQIQDIRDYQSMLTTGFERDLYSQSISPSTLFNRYGTHFLTSAVLGGRINNYYYLQSSEEKDLTTMSASIDAEVRGVLVGGSVEGSFEYKQEAAKNNISIKNTLSVMGGSGFGMLSDEDIRTNYADWEQSLKDKPALVGIKDRSSLYELWELIDPDKDTSTDFSWIDENGLQQQGTRRDQLQAYFFKYGLDAYNSLMQKYNIPGIEKPKEITNITIDGTPFDTTNTYNLNKEKQSAIISFDVLPETALGYTKTFSLISESDKEYASIDNQGLLIVQNNTPDNTIVQIKLGAGGINKIIRIKLNYYSPNTITTEKKLIRSSEMVVDDDNDNDYDRIQYELFGYDYLSLVSDGYTKMKVDFSLDIKKLNPNVSVNIYHRPYGSAGDQGWTDIDANEVWRTFDFQRQDITMGTWDAGYMDLTYSTNMHGWSWANANLYMQLTFTK